MIGLDTNVLVRYLTRDDASQYARAAAQIEGAAARGEPLVVNTAVLCELVWVLESAYDYSREEIAGALEQILDTAGFEVERADDARAALSDFRATPSDFTDALIGRMNRSLGAAHTLTFDRSLKNLDTFRLL